MRGSAELNRSAHNLRKRRKAKPVLVTRPGTQPQLVAAKRFVKPSRKTHGRYWYLRTDHWKEVRKQAKVRDGFGCTCCGTLDGPLEVHHLHYANAGQELLEDVVTLCQPCHNVADEIRRATP